MPRCTHSLWVSMPWDSPISRCVQLMPKGDTAERLQREIKLLAAAHAHAPEFQPHVTLIPDIKLQGEEVVARTKELASRLKVWAGVEVWAEHAGKQGGGPSLPVSCATHAQPATGIVGRRSGNKTLVIRGHQAPLFIPHAPAAIPHQLSQCHPRRDLLPVRLHPVRQGAPPVV